MPDRARIAFTSALITTAVITLVAAFLVPNPNGERQLNRAIRLHSAATTLSARLLASTSATETLTAWCAENQLASPAVITAHREPDATNPATAEQRALLGVGPDEPLGYRHVELRCGARLFSTAENWFVWSRLTDDMRRQLADPANTTPFGTVIKPIGPSRRITASVDLWTVLPRNWEAVAGNTVRDFVRDHREVLPHRENRSMFRHEAIVLGDRAPASGRPVALVHETYRMGALRHIP